MEMFFLIGIIAIILLPGLAMTAGGLALIAGAIAKIFGVDKK